MALTSMRLSSEERRDEYPVASSSDDGPLYPWGLTLHLDDTVLEKLGLEGLPTPGSQVAIVARADVESAASEKRASGVERRVTLQITAMDVQPAQDAADVASSMYPSMAEADGD